MCGGLEDDAAGKLLHLFEVLTKLSVIKGGLLHLNKLVWGQGDRDSFLCHLASPLITGAAPFAGGTILDRALADIAQLAQLVAPMLILALCGAGRIVVFHP